MVAQIHRFGDYEPYSNQWFVSPIPQRGPVYPGAPGWGSFEDLVANYPQYSATVEANRLLIPQRKDVWDIIVPKLVSGSVMVLARQGGARGVTLSATTAKGAEEHGIAKLTEAIVNKIRGRSPQYSNSLPSVSEIKKLVDERKAQLDREAKEKRKKEIEARNARNRKRQAELIANLYKGSTDLEGLLYPPEVNTEDKKWNWNCEKYNYPKGIPGGCKTKLRTIIEGPDRPDVMGAPRPPGWRPEDTDKPDRPDVMGTPKPPGWRPTKPDKPDRPDVMGDPRPPGWRPDTPDRPPTGGSAKPPGSRPGTLASKPSIRDRMRAEMASQAAEAADEEFNQDRQRSRFGN